MDDSLLFVCVLKNITVNLLYFANCAVAVLQGALNFLEMLRI